MQLCLWGLMGALPVGAVTQQSFQVGATITPGCSVASGSGSNFGSLNFGTHSGVESGITSNAFIPNTSLALACTPGVALSMSIDGGKNYTSVRNMLRTGSSEKVPYRLYTSGALTANTEILVNQAVAITYSNSNSISLPIFGAAQLTGFSPAGAYTDQLTVTLSW
ncbi:spore coat U domain-containing protein [Buttiauxella sp. A111]|uniref:Csu type fimbrial protein n=1 Tax=Buttiauxella sp. A111 TaxID=2563088 RepID=UPI0035A343BE